MSLFYRLALRLRALLRRGKRIYELDERLSSALEELAVRERRTPYELHTSLISSALEQQGRRGTLWEQWQALSAREQEVAALACLGYTNKEIALRLFISPETVKTHMKNVLVKFRLGSKNELRLALRDWDFRAWERFLH